MKIFTIIGLLMGTLFASDNNLLIRKYFSIVNTFSVELDNYTEKCGHGGFDIPCSEYERSIKMNTLSTFKTVANDRVYKIWEAYFTENGFHSCAYSDFNVYDVKKIVQRDEHYFVITETKTEYVTYKVTIHMNLIHEINIVRSIKKS